MFNTSFNLAYASLKKRPKKVRPLILLILIMTVLSTTAFGLLDAYSNAETQKLYEEYGSWKYAVLNIDLESANNFQEKYENIYLAYRHDNVSIGDNEYTIYSIEPTLSNVVSMNLSEGHYPKKDDEIALTYQVLNALDPSKTIGDTLLINDKSYTLSGILLDYSYISDNFEFPNIIVKSGEITGVDLYSKNSKLIGYDLSPEGNFVTNGYTTVISVDATLMIGFYGTIILLVTLVCIIAMSSSLMNDRLDEFSLLKGLGATSYQINTMILCESGLLSLLVIPAGLIIGELLHLILLLFYDVSLYRFKLNSLLLIGFIVFLIVLFGTYVPYNKAARHILSGNFRFSYKMFKADKIKGRISSFRLGIRMLTNKFSICFFFFVLLAFTYNKMIGIIDLYTLSNLYQESLSYIENDHTVVVNGRVFGTGYNAFDKSMKVSEDELQFAKDIGVSDIHLLTYNPSIFYLHEQTQLTYEVISELRYDSTTHPQEFRYFSSPLIFSTTTNSYDYFNSLLDVGRLPEHENEIVLFLPHVGAVERIYGDTYEYDYILTSKSTIEVGQILDLILLYNKLTIDNDNPNAYITDINDNRYTSKYDNEQQYPMEVVGIIYYEEFGYAFSNQPAIIVQEDFFNSLYHQNFETALFKCQNEHQFQQLSSLLTNNGRSFIDVNLKYNRLYDYIKLNQSRFNDELVETMIMVFAMMFIFVYINYYQVQASHELIGLLRINGASFKDLYKMYISQSLIINFMALLFSHYFILYDLFIADSYLLQVYPVYLHVLSVIVLVILVTIAYCLPLRKLEKYEAIELIRFKE